MIEERCRLAEQAGAVLCAAPGDEGMAAIAASLDELTSGRGADHVFLAAGGSSNAPVETAARLARDRARVVDIGKTRLDLPWNAYYDKELDVRFSRSYGPGRYDDRYELEGIDYPAGYVRWTERRNLECFLDLLARKDHRGRDARIRHLPAGERELGLRRPVLRRAEGRRRPARVPGAAPDSLPRRWQPGPRRRPSVPARAPRGRTDQLASSWRSASSARATTPHRCCCRAWLQLPNALAGPCRDHQVTVRGERPAAVRLHHGFDQRSGRARDDESLDAIFVVTRHHTHADLVCRALETGKAVFVEKPLALTSEELDRIIEMIANTGNDRLMVGFNRRFAPMLTQMRSQFGPASSSAVTRYLVNAGPLSGGQLVPERGAGGVTVHRRRRSLHRHAELVGGQPARGGVRRPAARDTTTSRSPCGSGTVRSGVISYVTGGNTRFPKETFDAAGGGRSARLDNFRKATVWAGRGHEHDPGAGRPGQGPACRAGPRLSRPA